MGMFKNFTDIINVLNFDENLLRLLHYSPSNLAKGIPDPLDITLQNILDMEEEAQWNIRYEKILFTSKSDDLSPDNPICRLFVYPGRRNPDRGNYAISDQEVVIDILVHNFFENGDLRSTRISDRLNELLVSERITGIGKMTYYNGTPISSPKEYVGYRHVYEFGSVKK